MSETTSARRPLGAPEHLLWASRAEAAGLAAHFDWSVFPCAPDKSPACHWPSWVTPYPSDVEARWPQKGAAVGVACKPSGLVVVDHDDDSPSDWPTTGTYARLSINRARPHEFFLQRADRPPLRCGKLTFGDVKGDGADGGYVVLSDRPDNGQPIIPVPDESYDAISRYSVGSGVLPAFSRASVDGDVRSLIAQAPDFDATATASAAFVRQHLERFERRQYPGNRHDEMRSAVAAAFIEGHAGLLDLGLAYDELRASWQTLKADEPG